MTRKPRADWDAEDVKAAVRKSPHKSFAALGRAHGLEPGTLRAALTKSAPRYEAIIAAALGLAPQDIWPSRYTHEALKANPWRRFALARGAGNTEGFEPESKHKTALGMDSTRRPRRRNVDRTDMASAG
ncbi:MAG: helix-turn-helix domain-containing protein [Zoogloea sp.]|uniref:helix-turn-helix domain-containing protein n=1 Tax=Zoogloea sp. TaxID=49181 RepID=UPI00262D0A44|nr:helix-turn-helix domain-containing protein [Zoogloea sp.]MDD3329522.1 helix-turn-helix domain-containing protein [Zoogloea sp.]